MNAGIYVRISDDREGRGLGVARQEADCRSLCHSRGWTIAKVYVDNDISASKGRVRPGYGQLCDDLKNGVIEAVVAYHNDRLHRSARELEDFIDLVQLAGAEVATVAGGLYDLTTATGQMTARIIGAVAKAESDRLGERNRRKQLELAEAGAVAGGGHRPYGFEDDRVTIRENEAAVIREAAARVLAGEGIRGICVDLTARGAHTATGAAWAPFSLRRVLLSARVAGKRQHQGSVIGKAVWPAILDELTWNRVTVILTDPARRVNGNPRRYLLTGLAVCGIEGCGARLVARPRGDKRRCYVCASGPGFTGCGGIRSLAEPLEAYVVAKLFDALDAGTLAAAAPGDELLDRALARAGDLKAKMAELAGDYYADHAISKEQFVAASRRLSGRLAEAKREAAALSRRTTSALIIADGDLRARWKFLGFDVQRAFVVEHVERVVLTRAVKGRNFFDPGRVSIEWW